MASNYHITESGAVDSGYTFDKAVGHLNVTVQTGVVFTVSLDGGENYLTLPVGFSSMPVGPIKTIQITSDGAFSLVGVQT